MNRHVTTAVNSSRGILCLLPCLLALLLTACGSTQSAYLDDGGGLTLSVVREQSYLGGPWQSTLISAATPRCQKRHPLEGMSEDGFVARFRAGRSLAGSKMPWEAFVNLTESDLRSLFRFLQSLPPVRHDVGPSHRAIGWKPPKSPS